MRKGYFSDQPTEMYSKARLVKKTNNNGKHFKQLINHKSSNDNRNFVTWMKLLLVLISVTSCLLAQTSSFVEVEANVLMRVCDTREIKTVTSRVCMLYKRTQNSDVKMDKQGNISMAKGGKGEYSPAKLASDCCKIGCPPHIFAYNC